MLIEKSLNLPVGSLKIIKFSSDISNFLEFLGGFRSLGGGFAWQGM